MWQSHFVYVQPFHFTPTVYFSTEMVTLKMIDSMFALVRIHSKHRALKNMRPQSSTHCPLRTWEDFFFPSLNTYDPHESSLPACFVERLILQCNWSSFSWYTQFNTHSVSCYQASHVLNPNLEFLASTQIQSSYFVTFNVCSSRLAISQIYLHQCIYHSLTLFDQLT